MVTHMNTPANKNKECCMTYIINKYANSNILNLRYYDFYSMKNNNSNNKTNTMMNLSKKNIYILHRAVI